MSRKEIKMLQDHICGPGPGEVRGKSRRLAAAIAISCLAMASTLLAQQLTPEDNIKLLWLQRQDAGFRWLQLWVCTHRLDSDSNESFEQACDNAYANRNKWSSKLEAFNKTLADKYQINEQHSVDFDGESGVASIVNPKGSPEKDWHPASRAECEAETTREYEAMAKGGTLGDPGITVGSSIGWSTKEGMLWLEVEPCGYTDGHGQFRPSYSIGINDRKCQISEAEYSALYTDNDGKPGRNKTAFDKAIDRCRLARFHELRGK